MDVAPMALVFLAFCSLVISAPLWVPISFAAYAFGRKQFTIRDLLILMALEGVAIVVVLSVLPFLFIAKE